MTPFTHAEGSERRSGRVSFVLYALACVALNAALSFAVSHQGDQEFWVRNVGHLRDHGFADFPGDYPPIRILWFHGIGALFTLLGIPFGAGYALKFFGLWPVMIAHVLLLRVVWAELCACDASPERRRMILGLAAFNPALLLDGPVWGQIDLFPAMIAVGALHAATRGRRPWLAAPLFAVALLTKFQAIAFLPVIGAVILRDPRVHVRGLLVAVAIVAVVFAPFYFTGTLGPILDGAYVHTMGEYPHATFNAANLWMLVVGNMVPDGRSVLGGTPDGLPGSLLSLKVLGMAAFSLFSVFVLVAAWRAREARRLWRLATLSAAAFFVLLPGMHERYLLPAITMGLIWAASEPERWPWSLGLTAIGFLNMQMVLAVRGEAVWKVVSAAAVAGLVHLSIRTFVGEDRWRFPRVLVWLDRHPWLPEAALALFLAAETAWLALSS